MQDAVASLFHGNLLGPGHLVKLIVYAAMGDGEAILAGPLRLRVGR